MSLVVKYPLDLTGDLPTHRLLNRELKLVGGSQRIAVLPEGAFFTNKLVVRDKADGRQLEPQIEYVPVFYHDEASQRSGLEVCVGIVVKNVNVSENVLVDVNIVGSPYNNLGPLLEQTLDELLLDNRTVNWGDLLGKPTNFVPTEHLQHFDTMYGMERLVESVDRLAQAIYIGDIESHDEMIRIFNELIQNVGAQATSIFEMLRNHMEDTGNVHSLTKADIELDNVPNVDATDANNINKGTLNNDRLNKTSLTQEGITRLSNRNADFSQADSPGNDWGNQTGEMVSRAATPRLVSKLTRYVADMSNKPTIIISRDRCAKLVSRDLSTEVTMTDVEAFDNGTRFIKIATINAPSGRKLNGNLLLNYTNINRVNVAHVVTSEVYDLSFSLGSNPSAKLTKLVSKKAACEILLRRTGDGSLELWTIKNPKNDIIIKYLSVNIINDGTLTEANVSDAFDVINVRAMDLLSPTNEASLNLVNSGSIDVSKNGIERKLAPRGTDVLNTLPINPSFLNDVYSYGIDASALINKLNFNTLLEHIAKLDDVKVENINPTAPGSVNTLMNPLRTLYLIQQVVSSAISNHNHDIDYKFKSGVAKESKSVRISGPATEAVAVGVLIKQSDRDNLSNSHDTFLPFELTVVVKAWDNTTSSFKVDEVLTVEVDPTVYLTGDNQALGFKIKNYSGINKEPTDRNLISFRFTSNALDSSANTVRCLFFVRTELNSEGGRDITVHSSLGKENLELILPAETGNKSLSGFGSGTNRITGNYSLARASTVFLSNYKEHYGQSITSGVEVYKNGYVDITLGRNESTSNLRSSNFSAKEKIRSRQTVLGIDSLTNRAINNTFLGVVDLTRATDINLSMKINDIFNLEGVGNFVYSPNNPRVLKYLELNPNETYDSIKDIAITKVTGNINLTIKGTSLSLEHPFSNSIYPKGINLDGLTIECDYSGEFFINDTLSLDGKLFGDSTGSGQIDLKEATTQGKIEYTLKLHEVPIHDNYDFTLPLKTGNKILTLDESTLHNRQTPVFYLILERKLIPPVGYVAQTTGRRLTGSMTDTLVDYTLNTSRLIDVGDIPFKTINRIFPNLAVSISDSPLDTTPFLRLTEGFSSVSLGDYKFSRDTFLSTRPEEDKKIVKARTHLNPLRVGVLKAPGGVKIPRLSLNMIDFEDLGDYTNLTSTRIVNLPPHLKNQFVFAPTSASITLSNTLFSGDEVPPTTNYRDYYFSDKVSASSAAFNRWVSVSRARLTDFDKDNDSKSLVYLGFFKTLRVDSDVVFSKHTFLDKIYLNNIRNGDRIDAEDYPFYVGEKQFKDPSGEVIKRGIPFNIPSDLNVFGVTLHGPITFNMGSATTGTNPTLLDTFNGQFYRGTFSPRTDHSTLLNYSGHLRLSALSVLGDITYRSDRKAGQFYRGDQTPNLTGVGNNPVLNFQGVLRSTSLNAVDRITLEGGFYLAKANNTLWFLTDANTNEVDNLEIGKNFALPASRSTLKFFYDTANSGRDASLDTSSFNVIAKNIESKIFRVAGNSWAGGGAGSLSVSAYGISSGVGGVSKQGLLAVNHELAQGVSGGRVNKFESVVFVGGFPNHQFTRIQTIMDFTETVSGFNDGRNTTAANRKLEARKSFSSVFEREVDGTISRNVINYLTFMHRATPTDPAIPSLTLLEGFGTSLDIDKDRLLFGNLSYTPDTRTLKTGGRLTIDGPLVTAHSLFLDRYDRNNADSKRALEIYRQSDIDRNRIIFNLDRSVTNLTPSTNATHDSFVFTRGNVGVSAESGGFEIRFNRGEIHFGNQNVLDANSNFIFRKGIELPRHSWSNAFIDRIALIEWSTAVGGAASGFSKTDNLTKVEDYRVVQTRPVSAGQNVNAATGGFIDHLSRTYFGEVNSGENTNLFVPNGHQNKFIEFGTGTSSSNATLTDNQNRVLSTRSIFSAANHSSAANRRSVFNFISFTTEMDTNVSPTALNLEANVRNITRLHNNAIVIDQNGVDFKSPIVGTVNFDSNNINFNVVPDTAGFPDQKRYFLRLFTDSSTRTSLRSDYTTRSVRFERNSFTSIPFVNGPSIEFDSKTLDLRDFHTLNQSQSELYFTKSIRVRDMLNLGFHPRNPNSSENFSTLSPGLSIFSNQSDNRCFFVIPNTFGVKNDSLIFAREITGSNESNIRNDILNSGETFTIDFRNGRVDFAKQNVLDANSNFIFKKGLRIPTSGWAGGGTFPTTADTWSVATGGANSNFEAFNGLLTSHFLNNNVANTQTSNGFIDKISRAYFTIDNQDINAASSCFIDHFESYQNENKLKENTMNGKGVSSRRTFSVIGRSGVDLQVFNYMSVMTSFRPELTDHNKFRTILEIFNGALSFFRDADKNYINVDATFEKRLDFSRGLDTKGSLVFNNQELSGEMISRSHRTGSNWFVPITNSSIEFNRINSPMYRQQYGLYDGSDITYSEFNDYMNIPNESEAFAYTNTILNTVQKVGHGGSTALNHTWMEVTGIHTFNEGLSTNGVNGNWYQSDDHISRSVYKPYFSNKQESSKSFSVRRQGGFGSKNELRADDLITPITMYGSGDVELGKNLLVPRGMYLNTANWNSQGRFGISAAIIDITHKEDGSDRGIIFTPRKVENIGSGGSTLNVSGFSLRDEIGGYLTHKWVDTISFINNFETLDTGPKSIIGVSDLSSTMFGKDGFLVTKKSFSLIRKGQTIYNTERDAVTPLELFSDGEVRIDSKLSTKTGTLELNSALSVSGATSMTGTLELNSELVIKNGNTDFPLADMTFRNNTFLNSNHGLRTCYLDMFGELGVFSIIKNQNFSQNSRVDFNYHQQVFMLPTGWAAYGASAWNTTSDMSIKEVIIENVEFDNILEAPIFIYKYKKEKTEDICLNDERCHVGTSANWFEEHFSLITTRTLNDDGTPGLLNMDYSKIGLLLIPKVKEQKEKLEAQEAKIQSLEEKLEALEAKLNQLLDK